MQPTGAMEIPPWMRAEATGAVLAALMADGATARFVGGCVRDTLLGRPVKDIDIAIDRPPADNIAALNAARIGVHETGVQHGTILAVSGGQHYEITTLRVDAETFGRHARVEFTDDWVADAGRRDFTMNAIFADADGSLYDPAGGRADIEAGVVRFVGDAAARIEEDFLRILRFFRFHAWYGRGAADAAALAACKTHAAGIDGLSGERICQELLRLLAAPDPVPSLELMAGAGILPRVLPGGADFEALARLLSVDAGNPDPLRRLAALTPGEAAAALADRLRLSRADKKRLILLTAPEKWPPRDADEKALRPLAYRIGPPAIRDLALLQADPATAAVAARMAHPEFPLYGRDAIALGLEPGTAVGTLLAELEQWWLDRGCRDDRDASLAELKRRVESSQP